MAKNNKKRKLPRSLKKLRSKKKRLPQGTSLSSYNITFEALEIEEYPEEFEKQFEELHDLVHNNPKEAIPRLQELKEKYPEIPMLYNWLSAAFSSDGQPKEAEAIAKENYEKHPEYLFAKLNYAEFFLKCGEAEEVSNILGGKFDLKMLYPDRDTFHITEAVSFLSLTGRYCVATDKIESAQACYKVLMDIAPDHPATAQLMQELAPSALDTLLSWKRR
jgi:tetratricopeptide (TPR) repeat protein